MIDFTEIAYDSDHWELFARDFLSALGFHVETPPNRGADGGQDLLVSEEIRGVEFVGRFRWLVSCKHFATSNRSVNETKDEANIEERVHSFNADGFLGFYSTLASSGLTSRLQRLRENNRLQEFRIFDGKLIENHLITSGYSHLLLRYCPNSYRAIRPLHNILTEYLPLQCEVCEVDLLHGMFAGDCTSVFARAYRVIDSRTHVEDVYVACKGRCDSELKNRFYTAHDLMTDWADLSDLTVPINYLQWLIATMNKIRTGREVFSEHAFEKEKSVMFALAQKVLRHTTAAEREKFLILLSTREF